MEGTSGYWLTRLLLQRGLGLTYLIAFLVVVNQFRPLLGENGLQPAQRFMQLVPFREAPSIFYLWPKDAAYLLSGWMGVVLAVLAVTGLSERFGTLFSMAVWTLLWLLYLSFVNIGQTFYGFGWESLLLESGFLAIFLGGASTDPKAVMIWLFRWILFRLIFGAGLIKWRGDPCWRDLTCLDYHFETQPMPNPLSWYFHWLPAWLHRGGVLFNHLVELVVPFFYFAPQPLAAVAGLLTLLFQGALLVSGNFSWLTLLTMVLALSTFSDAGLAHFLPLAVPPLQPPTPAHTLFVWGVTLLVALLSIKPVRNLLSPYQVMNASYNPLHLVNTYGAFGSVTRPRYELVVEGTADRVITEATQWSPYEFRGKPGDRRRLPPQIAPYHLRLDWLMWFAAMEPRNYPPWLLVFLARLLEGDTGTLALLRSNPFPAAPPARIRVVRYIYRFTTPAERRETGNWWERKEAGVYLPPLSLADPAFRNLVRRFTQ